MESKTRLLLLVIKQEIFTYEKSSAIDWLSAWLNSIEYLDV